MKQMKPEKRLREMNTYHVDSKESMKVRNEHNKYPKKMLDKLCWSIGESVDSESIWLAV